MHIFRDICLSCKSSKAVVAFSRENFGVRFDDSFPASAFIFLSGDQLTYTNSTFFKARISPQWLSELR